MTPRGQPYRAAMAAARPAFVAVVLAAAAARAGTATRADLGVDRATRDWGWATSDRGSAERVLSLVVGDRISLTPPMGWNSWNCFATDVTQAKVEAAAGAMARSRGKGARCRSSRRHELPIRAASRRDALKRLARAPSGRR